MIFPFDSNVARKLSMKKISSRLCLAAAGVFATSTLTVVQAQSERTDPPQKLPTVVVEDVKKAESGLALDTASQVGSRLGLSLRETPASVAVITRETFLDRGDSVAAGAVARSVGFAPVGMSAFAGAALAARGFSGNNSVGQLYDGNRLFVSGGAMSFPVDTWPFERIEVLSGPATVLYSTGSIGGAVNYVPRTIRRDTIVNEALVSFGSWDTARVGVASAGPINPAAAYRLNALTSHSAGYVDRNDRRNNVVSGALKFDLASTLALTLMFDGSDEKLSAYFGTPLINGVIDARTRRLNYNVDDASTRFQNNWSRASLEWQALPGVLVKNELYHLNTDRDFRNLENYTYKPATGRVERSFNFGTDIDQTQIGNRLDVLIDGSLNGRRNRLITGIEVNRIDFKTANVTSGATDVDPFNFNPGLFLQGNNLRPTLGTRTSQAALFAENVLDIMPSLKLVSGVRVDHIDLKRSDKITGAQVDYKFSPFTWRLGTVYDLTPALSLYAQYGTGNDAAGSLISLPAATAAKLQLGKQVEAGAKLTFLDRRADLTVALYQIEKDNLTSRDPLLPNVAQQIGKQSSRGIELALSVRPVQGLIIDANATVLQAKFENFKELVSGVVLSRAGNLPPNTPERLANLFASYRFGGGAGFEIGGGARYVGPRFANNANTLSIPAYTVTDVFIGYRWVSGTVVTARVRNVFDRQWVTAPYNGGAQWALGDPRSAEISARWTF